MNTVSTGPDVGQGSDAPDEHTHETIIPGEGPPPRLNFSDLAAVRAWLEGGAARVADLAAVADDQTSPNRKRQLGRAKARDILRDNRKTLADLIALARAGLPAAGGAS